MNVGFIGLGRMGTPMARNLAAADFALTVYDARADASSEFADIHGAKAASEVGEVFTSADLVITMLPNGAIVRAVVSEGMAADTGGRGLVVDMSSSAPSDTATLAKLVTGRGWELVDAPVSGGVARAETGDLSILAGGSAGAVDCCQPVFDVLGRETFRVGSVGCGHTMKALNNVMSAAGLLLASEALLVGRKHGLEPDVMLRVLNASTGRNHATETKIAPYVLSGTYASGFALDLMVKDLAIARELAREAGSPYLAAALVTSVWELAARQVPAGADQMELVRWLEELAGVGLAAGPQDETEKSAELEGSTEGR